MHRRQLLKAGAAATAYFSFAGISAGIPKRAEAATVQFDIQASALDYQLPGLTPPVLISTWQFVNVANPSLPFATELRVMAGDVVVIRLSNSLTVPINLVIPGLLTDSAECPPGGSVTYTFTAPVQPGSYIFYDALNGIQGRGMGLNGALVVLTADGAMTLADGTAYDREHSLIFAEVDSRLNTAVASGSNYDIANYEPDYFFVNGKIYIKDLSHIELQMSVGENVLFRLINNGLIYYPMHFHGYHVSVINRNSTAEPFVRNKDTVTVKPSETVEAILNVNQPGLYPLHTHFLPGVTNNGNYAGGGLMIMNAA